MSALRRSNQILDDMAFPHAQSDISRMRGTIRAELDRFWNEVLRVELAAIEKRIGNESRARSRPRQSEWVAPGPSHRRRPTQIVPWNREGSSVRFSQRVSVYDGSQLEVPPSPKTPKTPKTPKKDARRLIREHFPREEDDVRETPRPMLLLKEGSGASDQFDEMGTLLRGHNSGFIESTTSWWSRLRGFVRSENFEFIIAFLIISNAVSIGIQVHLSALGWTADQLSPFEVLNRITFLLFYIETSLRCISYQPTFHKYVQRNALDVGIITLLFFCDLHTVIGRVFGWDILKHCKAFSVVRLVRNFRVLRVIHNPTILRLSRRLRIFVASFEDSLTSLLCALIYVFLVNYMIAVLLTETVAECKIRNPNLFENHADDLSLIEFFASIPIAMLSLWEITLDGYVCGVHWGTLLRTFYEYLPLWASALFIGFMSLMKLGVLAIITGIFTTYAMKNAHDDNMFVLQSFAAAFLYESDKDGDCVISWEEFYEQLDHPLLLEFFPEIATEPEKAKRLFDGIDEDGSGECSLEELICALASRAKF